MIEFEHPYIRREYLHQLIDACDANPLVIDRKLHSRVLKVYFETGVVERWFRLPFTHARPEMIIPFNPFVGRDIQVSHQYEYDPTEPNRFDGMHFIHYKTWRKASFYRKRLVIQEYLYRLLKEGYLPVCLPRQELQADLQALWDADVWRHHARGDSFKIIGHYFHNMPGQKLIEQFADWGEQDINNFRNAWESPRRLHCVLNHLLRHRRDCSRHNLLYRLSRSGDNRTWRFARFICPNLYRIIFQRLEMSGMVLADPFPGFGSKALAATMESITYCSPKQFNELGSFIGTDFLPLDRPHYDCVILDYDFHPPSLERLVTDLKEWAPKADMKLVFVPAELVSSLPEPTFSLPLITRVIDPNFIFCYL